MKKNLRARIQSWRTVKSNMAPLHNVPCLIIPTCEEQSGVGDCALCLLWRNCSGSSSGLLRHLQTAGGRERRVEPEEAENLLRFIGAPNTLILHAVWKITAALFKKDKRENQYLAVGSGCLTENKRKNKWIHISEPRTHTEVRAGP